MFVKLFITKLTKIALKKLKTDASLNCCIFEILGNAHEGKNLNDSVRLSFYLTSFLYCVYRKNIK